MSGTWRLRAAVLTLGGALVVHQGRYAMAPREHDGDLAAAHGYIGWLMPLAAALVFLVALELGAAIAARRALPASPLPSGRALWVTSALTLLAVFGVQETIEMTAAEGRLPAAVELLAHGGWQVAALSVAVGGVLALLLRGAARAVRWALRRGRSAPRRRAVLRAARHRPVLTPSCSVLARNLAGRAPPIAS